MTTDLYELIAKEGDFEEWTAEGGYLCRIKRSKHLGMWCGYIRVPKGHPVYGHDYDNIGVEVHGGLTFADSKYPGDNVDENYYWWIGFDCGHVGDKIPSILFTSNYTSEVYRTKEYVITETNSLANQLRLRELEKIK